MDFNLEDYISLDTKEVELAIKKADENIRKLKNILVERDNQAYHGFINHDLDLLKKSLEHNKDKTLDGQIWAVLTFKGINETHIDFVKYVMSLPEYRANNSSNYGPISRTSEAVLTGLKNKKLFDFFVENKEFEQSFKFLLNPQDDAYGINNNVPKEIIHELFQRKMLEPKTDLIEFIIEKRCSNFLDYILKKRLYKFNKDEYKNLYFAFWDQQSESIHKLIKKEYPEFKDINLDHVINNGKKVSNKEYIQNYLKFLTLDEKTFTNLLRSHPMSQTECTYIINCFNDVQEYHKFHKFVDFIVSEKPEMIDYLKKAKKYVQTNLLKVEFDKAMSYIDMKQNLGSSNEEITKKLKI